MKINTTMRYQYSPIRMAKIQKLTMPNDSKDVEQQELSHTAAGNAITITLEGSLTVSYKI